MAKLESSRHFFEQLEMVGCFPHPSRDLKKSPGSWRFGRGQGWERPLFTGAKMGRFDEL